MKTRLFKSMSTVLASFMAIALFVSGCGNANQQKDQVTTKSEATEATQAQKDELKPVILKWVTRCNPQPGYTDVETEMNKVLKDKINASVSFDFLEVGSFDQKVKTMMAAGEEMDIVFTSSFANDYYSAVAKGALLPLDDLLTQYAPMSYAQVPKVFWDATKVDNKIYGFINYQIVARQNAITVQKAMLDKYKFDLTGINKLEELEPLLEKMKQGEPDKTVVEMSKDGMYGTLLTYYGLDEIGARNTPGVILINDDAMKVVNQFELQSFKEHINLMRKWYTKGYFVKDVATFTALVDARKTGNVLSSIIPTKPGIEGEIKVSYANDMIVQPIDRPFATTGAVISTLNGISKTSKNPERAMMLLEIVNSDKAFNNLLNFGIENKNYKKIGDNQIELIKDSGYSPNRAWTFGTQFLAYYMPGQALDNWEKTKILNESADTSKAMGFNFNSEPVNSEIAQCASVVAEFGPGLWTGFIDPDEYLPQFINKLKAAGADKIIAEKQKQLDAWKANKK